ncbi:uncharacterized protein J3R85_003247 [Psidium guajava]|nr:uncharacterized protein J3R85_003247 [Psidium guajava]
MAGSSSAGRVSLFAVLFMLLFLNAQGRALTRKRIDSRLHLRQLGYGDGAKPTSAERALAGDVNPAKHVPGGSDPIHNGSPPTVSGSP